MHTSIVEHTFKVCGAYKCDQCHAYPCLAYSLALLHASLYHENVLLREVVLAPVLA